MTELMKEVLATNEPNTSFMYQLMDRLRSDCDFFLGYGRRQTKDLWSGNVKDHIEDMKALHNNFTIKPEWLTMEQIEEYEAQMKGSEWQMKAQEQGKKLLENNPRYEMKLGELEGYMNKIFNASSDDIFYIVSDIYAYGIARGYNLGTRKNKKG